ncbi:hypothetical protein J6590_080008 [Homalodisca vitripennis]|nr:hypothetical protein J6590_080008 [Homalodisca vitripennis]
MDVSNSVEYKKTQCYLIIFCPDKDVADWLVVQNGKLNIWENVSLKIVVKELILKTRIVTHTSKMLGRNERILNFQSPKKVNTMEWEGLRRIEEEGASMTAGVGSKLARLTSPQTVSQEDTKDQEDEKTLEMKFQKLKTD